MKVPATAAVMGLAMWVGLGALSAAFSTPPIARLTSRDEWGTRAMAARAAAAQPATRRGE